MKAAYGGCRMAGGQPPRWQEFFEIAVAATTAPGPTGSPANRPGYGRPTWLYLQTLARFLALHAWRPGTSLTRRNALAGDQAYGAVMGSGR